MKDAEAIRAFCREHDPLIDKLTDVLTKEKVTPQTGERVLAFVIGVSVGLRLGSLTDDQAEILELMARGFQLGVNEASKLGF